MNHALLFTYARPTFAPAGAVTIPSGGRVLLVATPAFVGAALGALIGSRSDSSPVGWGIGGALIGAVALPAVVYSLTPVPV